MGCTSTLRNFHWARPVVPQNYKIPNCNGCEKNGWDLNLRDWRWSACIQSVGLRLDAHSCTRCVLSEPSIGVAIVYKWDIPCYDRMEQGEGGTKHCWEKTINYWSASAELDIRKNTGTRGPGILFSPCESYIGRRLRRRTKPTNANTCDINSSTTWEIIHNLMMKFQFQCLVSYVNSSWRRQKWKNNMKNLNKINFTIIIPDFNFSQIEHWNGKNWWKIQVSDKSNIYKPIFIMDIWLYSDSKCLFHIIYADVEQSAVDGDKPGSSIR